MHQTVQRLRLRPRPYCRSSQRSPNHLAGKGEGKGREGEGNRKGKGSEGRLGCLLLNLNLAICPWFACNVCQFIVRGAGLCYSCTFNPKAFTVSHLVTHKQTWSQATHQLNPALDALPEFWRQTTKKMVTCLAISTRHKVDYRKQTARQHSWLTCNNLPHV